MKDVATARGKYSAAVFGHRIGFGGRPAVVVVDMIEAFADLDSPFGFDLEEVQRNTTQLLEVARRTAVPIVFAITAYDNAQVEAGPWALKMPALCELKKGSRTTQLLPLLDRRADERVVIKKFASAFFGTGLGAQLLSLGVDTVVIAGCTTSGCIRATAVDAISAGFRPIVVADCVGDRLQDAHQANLVDLDAKYCDVVPLGQVLKQLNARSLKEPT